jgi:ribosomal protein S18 acetylase RimI-like enzyme
MTGEAVMTSEITYRRATAADSDLLADIVLGEEQQVTTQVAMRLYGINRFDVARALFRTTWRAGDNWRLSEIAMEASEPVGVIQVGSSSMKVTPQVVLAVLRALGPRALARLPHRMHIQRRVSPAKPPGAFVVAELHVAPEWRGRGAGQAMLEHAESEAREGQYREMALHTLTNNPARRLYERFGFRVVETCVDDEFRRLTGSDGNLLMIKDLS